MLRSRSLDLSFIRRGRKRSAIRCVSQAFLRSFLFIFVSRSISQLVLSPHLRFYDYANIVVHRVASRVVWVLRFMFF